jgi:hypothetical protein
MKIVSGLWFAMIMLFSIAAQAGGVPAVPASGKSSAYENRGESEIQSLNILLSKDGTGIIRDFECTHCNNLKIVKITPKTQVVVNGVSVALSRAAMRAGKPVFIQFDTKTAEVLSIRWSEAR